MKTIKCLMVFLLFAGLAYAADKAVEQKMFTATVDNNGVQRVEITGGEYYFDPNYIIVKKDVPVEFVVKKVSGAFPIPHNIKIEAPEAGINFNEDMPSKPKVIRFTPTKTGKYQISCDKRFLFFATHQEKGMEGTLEVVE
ncbi:MAG: cupredoxin domain-containing protein [Nitrospirae bacterium]|nr:cupredoxin domain-containing protein [Nitrospirota bacterium]